MKKRIILLLCLVAGLVLAGEKHSPHSTVTYLIVPVVDIDAAMLAVVAQSSTNSLRRSANGALAVLKFVRYKTKADPVPVPSPNDQALPAAGLEYNERLSVYPHAHKETPALLRPYKQYTHTEILLELRNPEWSPAANPATNSVADAEGPDT